MADNYGTSVGWKYLNNRLRQPNTKINYFSIPKILRGT